MNAARCGGPLVQEVSGMVGFIVLLLVLVVL